MDPSKSYWRQVPKRILGGFLFAGVAAALVTASGGLEREAWFAAAFVFAIALLPYRRQSGASRAGTDDSDGGGDHDGD